MMVMMSRRAWVMSVLQEWASWTFEKNGGRKCWTRCLTTEETQHSNASDAQSETTTNKQINKNKDWKREREREKSFCGRLSVWLLCVSRPACLYCVQELYKIPKKQRAEERKRTERELGGWFLLMSWAATLFNTALKWWFLLMSWAATLFNTTLKW